MKTLERGEERRGEERRGEERRGEERRGEERRGEERRGEERRGEERRGEERRGEEGEERRGEERRGEEKESTLANARGKHICFFLGIFSSAVCQHRDYPVTHEDDHGSVAIRLCRACRNLRIIDAVRAATEPEVQKTQCGCCQTREPYAVLSVPRRMLHSLSRMLRSPPS